jgi:hypothetical protein
MVRVSFAHGDHPMQNLVIRSLRFLLPVVFVVLVLAGVLHGLGSLNRLLEHCVRAAADRHRPPARPARRHPMVTGTLYLLLSINDHLAALRHLAPADERLRYPARS